MRIVLGCDHGGYPAKESVISFLENNNIKVIDCGTDGLSSVDYPDFAKKVCKEILSGKADLGILICGTGIGMSIAANKYKGIRAAVVYDEFTAKACKEHNNANVLCLGSRVLDNDKIMKLIGIWLNSVYEGGRHDKRLEKITEIENREL